MSNLPCPACGAAPGVICRKIDCAANKPKLIGVDLAGPRRPPAPHISIKDYGDGCFSIMISDGPGPDFRGRLGCVFRSNQSMSENSVRMLLELAEEAQRLFELQTGSKFERHAEHYP